MRHGKSSFLALIVLTGLTAAPTSVSAQQFGVVGFGGNAFAGNGFGANQGFIGNGFGGVNNFGSNGIGGFNNFSPYNRGYYGYTPTVPQTYNNMGGLMNSIRTQTGRGNSYRYGYSTVGSRRR